MTSISGVGGASSAWSAMAAAREQRQAKAFAKVDADNSGGVDSTELQTLFEDVAKKTGTTAGDASKVFGQLDADGSGSLDSSELGTAMKAILPPPSTMQFAQSRTGDSVASSGSAARGSAGDDLFGKVDADGSGGIDASELQTLMDRMAVDGGGSPSSASSASSTSGTSSTTDAAKRFAALDTDGDGSLTQAEFDAGRPSGADGAQAGQRGGGGQAQGGMPPPGGPGGAGGASSSASTTYDVLDTNEDGTVSIAERVAGATSASTATGTSATTGADSSDPLQALFKAVDSDSDGTVSQSESDVLLQKLTEALSGASTDDSSSSSSGSGKSGGFDLQHLAQMVLKQYEQVAGNSGSQATTTALSAVA